MLAKVHGHVHALISIIKAVRIERPVANDEIIFGGQSLSFVCDNAKDFYSNIIKTVFLKMPNLYVMGSVQFNVRSMIIHPHVQRRAGLANIGEPTGIASDLVN
jgi:hypothetical protein